MNDKLLGSWPVFSEYEISAVSRVLASGKVNYWTGDEGRCFEKEFAAYTQSQYAIALANGTVAIDLALHALDIGVGDEVIVTPRTFLASASSIVNAGAIPVFADVDPNSQNITAETISKVLTNRTKAIICVHLAGWPCDMDPIMDLAVQKNLFVIEDCAQAHGAKYKGRSVGSIGHINAWSFCQDKIMTTGGEGGMVTTNNESLWKKMWAYKDHGKSWDAVYNRQHAPGFRWLHESFGTNFRLTEMQSAIGRYQITQMKDWTEKRNQNAKMLEKVLTEFDCIRIVKPADNIVHAYYKYYAFVKPKNLKSDWDRDRIVNAINKLGVPCFQGSCSEIYLEKAFDNTGFRPKQRLSIAKELGETSLMFLIHPTLCLSDMTFMSNVIETVLGHAEYK